MLLANFTYIMESRRINRGNRNPNQGVKGITALKIAERKAQRLQRQKEVKQNNY